MEIFKQLSKKGYKHYYSGTVEELDSMDKNNPDLHSEIIQVVMWLYEKHGIWIYAVCDVDGNFYPKIYFSKEENWFNLELRSKMNEGNRVICRKEYKSPTEAYEAAITYTLNNLI